MQPQRDAEKQSLLRTPYCVNVSREESRSTDLVRCSFCEENGISEYKQLAKKEEFVRTERMLNSATSLNFKFLIIEKHRGLVLKKTLDFG